MIIIELILIHIAVDPLVFLELDCILHQVRVQKQKLLVLESNEVKSLAWLATHGAHHDVWLVEYEPDRIKVLFLNFVDTQHARYYN